MADEYEKLKVPDLKHLFKVRGIATTGVTRKAQYIEKLRAFDLQAAVKAAQVDEQQYVSADDATITADTPALPLPADDVQNKADSVTSSVTLPGDEAHTEEPPAQAFEQPPSVSEADRQPPRDLRSEPFTQPTSAPALEARIEVTAASRPEAVARSLSAPGQDDPPSTTVEPVSDHNEPSAQSSILATPVPMEEIQEDKMKRKRRSLTPPVNEDEMAVKRQKHQESTDQDLSFPEAPVAQIDSLAENEVKGTKGVTTKRKEESKERQGALTDEAPQEHTESSKQAKDVRYRALFQTGTIRTPQTAPITPTHDSANMSPPEDAIHPQTRALYVRNFMRPLQPHNLRKHLVDISAPAGCSSDPGIVEDFHLDQVRSHAFALFASTEAAVRARSALHGRVWPAERDRKALWADFVPNENLKTWINIEINADGGGRTGGRRWEVEYIKKEDGSIEAVLNELGGKQDGRSRPQADLLANRDTVPLKDIPTGPRSMSTAGPANRGGTGANNRPIARGPNTDPSFEKLSTLFQQTTAKPKVYHQPVSPEVAEARLEELRAQTSRDWTFEKWDDNDLFRFTFEEGDRLVHSGRHNTGGRVRAREAELTGVRNDPQPFRSGDRRGGYRGGYRGGNRGGYRGHRGGAGESYRP